MRFGLRALNAVANLGYAGVRFLKPVYPGDTVRTVSEVLGKKENRSGKNGIVWVRSTGTNQDGDTVLEYCRWVMVHKRDPGAPTGAADKPDMPAEVSVAELVVPEELTLHNYRAWPSGGSAYFDDYEVDEVIDHVDGMTIEEPEHMMATRLYQNTAKVHFDAHQAKATRFGRRLMYGGHVISVARSLSFNGLQNALGILAWNAGAHANPTFAGDTLYAYSKVLDKQPLPGREDLGALRLRLVACKNLEDDRTPYRVERDGKQVYEPSVVLDLDYWVSMPRRPAALDA